MAGQRRNKSLNPRTLLLNLVIIALGAVVIFLVYSFVNTALVNRPVEYTAESEGMSSEGQVIQLDVLNGCGASGVAQKITEYLRKRKFDVVQSSNHTSFDEVRSVVIDRVGDKSSARKVARALGIDESNIQTHINPDYNLRVSVIIGGDYQQLKPYQ